MYLGIVASEDLGAQWELMNLFWMQCPQGKHAVRNKASTHSRLDNTGLASFCLCPASERLIYKNDSSHGWLPSTTAAYNDFSHTPPE